MITATGETLTKHETLFEGNAGMVKSHTTLNSYVGELKEASMTQKYVAKGLGRARLEIEKVLVRETLDLFAAMSGCGQEKDNAPFVAYAEYSVTKLRRMRKPDLADLCEGAYNAASTIATDLEEYGYDSFMLGEYLGRVESFRTAVHAHRVAVGERAAATARIAELIQLATRLLTTRLDKQMLKYEKSAPSFFAAYTVVRRIVDLGVRHKTKADAAGGGDSGGDPTADDAAGGDVTV